MKPQIIILFSVIASWKCDEEKIEIGKPNYICKNGQVENVNQDGTNIKLLENEIDITYKFDVKFASTDHKCSNNQRCTLMMWREIRELNSFLNQYPPQLLQKGVIHINKTLIKPGIQYIISVKALKGGKLIDERRVMVDYPTEKAGQLDQLDAVLELLGPSYGYAHASYYINANVDLCSKFSFYLKWTVVDGAGNKTLFHYKGTELVIPPNLFQSLRNYTIQCDVIKLKEGTSSAHQQQNLKILGKKPFLRIPIKTWITKPNQPIHVKPHIRNFDNNKMQMIWTCVELTTNTSCIYKEETDELEAESLFTKPGEYKITLEIKENEHRVQDSCTVHITDNSPIVEIDETGIVANPLNELEIKATIYELNIFCTLQWVSIQEENYESIDLATVPGNPAHVINVTTKEDLFLHELEEYSNETLDINYNLLIPSPSGEWGGLKGDTKYLFRLIITCPSDNRMDQMNNDVIVETNSPPVVETLHVSPLEGEAFTTKFKFSSDKAQDRADEGPFLYNFGYTLGGKDVIVWRLLDVNDCESTLPYSEDGVQTFLECCDNLNNCRRIEGPLIKTSLPQEDFKQGLVLEQFNDKMIMEDYKKALLAASTILHSYKNNMPIRDYLILKIDDEIERFLHYAKQDNYWRNNVNYLMRSINDFNSQLQLPERTLNKLLKLRNKLLQESQKYRTRRLLFLRPKRTTASLNDTENYMQLSELMISTATDPNKINLEKENVRLQLQDYMEKLCKELKQKEVKAELKTLMFAVEKLTRNSFNRFISIPFEGNSWNVTGRVKFGNVVFVKDTKQTCLGKAIFKDYLQKSGLVFYVDVINAKAVDLGEVVVYLPKNQSLKGKPSCVVYKEGWQHDCEFVQNSPSYIQCSCKHLGYYYLEYKASSETALTSPSTTTEPNAGVIQKNNETLARIYREETSKKDDTVSYIVIVASVIGIVLLTVIVRKVFHEDDDDKDDTEPFDFPKYAQLYNEEYLNDAHI